MPRFFGTDGVRGVAGKDLSSAMAFVLGEAAVELLGPRLVVGRDTRASGPMLEAALIAGISSAGGLALLAGIIPTPAIALLTRELAACGGVVISASHNPPEYNGIKFFDAEGFKLTAELEDAFEARLQERCGRSPAPDAPGSCPAPDAPGSCPGSEAPGSCPAPDDSQGAAASTLVVEDALERYVRHVVGIIRSQGLDFEGLRVAVDCGHGASFAATPEALRRLGATVVAINTDFDGSDINVACGSTCLGPLRELVGATGADLGIAHDGDADRVLAVDENGDDLDGDFIEAICAIDLKERGRLAHDTVVTTTMCNLGFVTAMTERHLEVVQTDVGDSHVLAAMREGGFTLGGEQSGHMIFLEHNSTGDGLATALCLLAAMRRSGKPLSRLRQLMTRYPQVLINVEVANRAALESSVTVARALLQARERLKGQGRILVRPSGTEPLIRVMVEARDEQSAHEEAQRLASIIRQEL
ncbi:MAG: phosphoglucosamine mutase [Coriobacteriales bacterium]|jgi:phosphoglucosamine mutase|nr:phosphoglucosamine mutase [Coriobacteriales bacterium]